MLFVGWKENKIIVEFEDPQRRQEFSSQFSQFEFIVYKKNIEHYS